MSKTPKTSTQFLKGMLSSRNMDKLTTLHTNKTQASMPAAFKRIKKVRPK